MKERPLTLLISTNHKQQKPKMNTVQQERVLIGSSNVYRTYTPSTFTEYPAYKMAKCTRIEVFKTQMKSLEKTNKLIVISVIENFLADAAKKGEKENPEKYSENFDSILSEAIQEYVDAVKEAATRLPDSIFLLVKPILRPHLNWYDLNFDEICVDIKEKLSKIGRPNVSEIESLSRASQNFEADGVHLTPESGKVFIDCMIETAEAQYSVGPVVNLEEEEEDVRMESNEMEEEINTQEKTARKISFRPQEAKGQEDREPRLDTVEKSLTRLENAFKTKAWKDNLMTAKLREDLDFMMNVKNEDRIVLTGLTSTTPPPLNQDEKNLWIRAIAKEFIKVIDPESSEKVVFVKQGRSKDRDIPMAEVRFETKEIASKVRKMFVEKRKAGQDFGRVYMANCVTLATRVRIDLLKAIAKQFGGKDDQEMYVSAFTSRPILRIKNVKSQKTGILTFTDAISRFGKKLDLDDLDEAYRRAGRAFIGQMEQNFVVLTDGRRAPAPAPTENPKSSQTGNARKRPMEDQQLVFNRTKGPRVERGARGGRGGNGRGTTRFNGGGMAGSSTSASINRPTN